MAACRKCPAEWAGLKIAHCAACHETFSSVETFDMHRDKHKCRPPAESGLELSPTTGRWTKPLPEWLKGKNEEPEDE